MHIGSSGSNFSEWKYMARSSVLITLDGNEKKLNSNILFKKIITNKVIISDKNGILPFYETKDPHCSSLLEPDKKIYTKWYGAHRFKIRKKTKEKVLTLNSFLKLNKIKYIDWLIIDVQGMDLKILKKLNKNILKNITILDIEPGFFPFYKKADKIYEIFSFLPKYFDFEDMTFGYNYKVKSNNLNKIEKKILFLFNKPSKIYSNITFINKNTNERSLLLKMIYLAKENKLFELRQVFNDFFEKNKKYTIIKNSINREIIMKKVKFFFFIPFLYLKKILKLNDY